ncbi:MAG: DUF2752 domain-containing protein [Candidatus Amulumruptor caecigallinarius]|uniref:DUF2752 domain-containing protein n=1 Tax=Candidatus Amulumruptor caecigallinarius TaxID=2109911 RepID=A0A4Q0UA03_9BACT|nr:MAG: DUF2752 domain-containing protein [Candidatus Amulumruptor caecigallinarius]HJE40152.1 DUF2752 domain-containing protein [Candidatus Amulumruptor caecigallinarius]
MKKHPVRVIAAVVVAVTLIVIYGLVNPESRFFPKCMFLVVTGWKCPGCGSQRAIHALLNGDVGAAWGYNALLVSFIPLVAVMVIASLVRLRRPGFYNFVNSRWIIWSVFVVVVGWGIVRNVYGL